ncbi:MAG: hypothetical protein MMC33_005366 [Icmadophila ericetorum]|nr:hypothetical protein [Icmadophila ericetorum]
MSDKPQSKLILCFDGTGKQYNGNTSDTNVTKLYRKLDRKSPNQYHYYQPRIRNYTAGEKSLNAGPPARLKQSLSQMLDQAFANSFDSDVIAGYKFLMSYYFEGDHIYIIGFSRGAFTARYLARMLLTIGLLAMGNEEMVPSAYKMYRDYIKEVYLAGSHGDVGGGWLAKVKLGNTEDEGPLQLSDLPLEWMITEIMALPAPSPSMKIRWNEHQDLFLLNFAGSIDIAAIAPLHDPLKYVADHPGLRLRVGVYSEFKLTKMIACV